MRSVLAGLAREDVEIIDAGHGEHGQPLTHANRAKLVVKAAKSVGAAHGGGLVVRLMDGDPATFNGLAEEALACRKAGIAFEVVPGVSAVSAVPTYAGVPLTSAASPTLHVVSGGDTRIDWSRSTADNVTVVVLGTPESLGRALGDLLAAGRPASTPVAVTEHGTTIHQRTHTSTLGEVEALMASAEVEFPSLAVVGSTVGAARAALVVRDQAAVRLERPGAAHQGPGRVDDRPPRGVRRHQRRRPDDQRRAAAHAAADGARGQGPGHRPLRVDRLHLGQRRARRAREVRRVRPRRPRVRRPEGRRRRWGHRPGAARVGHRARPRAQRASSRPRACSTSGRRSTRSSTRSTGSSSRAPTSRPTPWSPACRTWAGRSTTSRRTAPSVPHRRPRPCARRSRPAATTRWSSPRAPRCATSSASPASRTPSTVVACIGPATAKTAEEHGLRVDVLAAGGLGRLAGRRARRLRHGPRARCRGGRRDASSRPSARRAATRRKAK